MKKTCSFVGYRLHSKGYRVYDHDNRIIMKCRDIFFLEDPTVSPRVEPRCVELYEISKGKGAQASGGSDEEDAGHIILGQGPLEVIEQTDDLIGRPIQVRKLLAYLNDYYSLLKTMQDLDPNSYSQVIKAQDAQYLLEAMREEI